MLEGQNNSNNWIVITVLAVVVLFCSCHPNTKESSYRDNMDSEYCEDAGDIDNESPPTISLKLIRPIGEIRNHFDLIYNVVKEDECNLYVEPEGNYYDRYICKERFMIPSVVTNGSFNYQLPTLEYYIVNNTDKPININRLDIEVDSSYVDKLPYVYIATLQDYSNQLLLVNCSCDDWNEAKLEYAIMKKGEIFDGNYKKIKKIVSFIGEKYIDFTNDLVDLGYDFEDSRKKSENPFDPEYTCNIHCINKDNLEQENETFKPFELEFEDTFEDMYHAVARIYGKLSFVKKGYSVEFVGKLSLSTWGDFGGESWLDDKFDVKLNSIGNNYVVSYPYKTTIRPGGLERVKVVIACEKSSFHTFRIKARNAEMIDLHSKTVHLHLLNHFGTSIVTEKAFCE